MANQSSALTDGKLRQETVGPIFYRIRFRDQTAPGGIRTLDVSCHLTLARGGFLELWRVPDGRLIPAATYSEMVSVEEL